MKIQLLIMLIANNNPLTSQDRKHIPLHRVDKEFIEAKYETVIKSLPGTIDRARDVMIRDTAVRNMFGYSIALSFFIGAALETAGWVLMKFRSLQEAFLQTVSSLEFFGYQWYMWWYGAGDAGPWYFPDAFGTGGDPNLKCSGDNFNRLVKKYSLDAGVASISKMRPVERFVLLERLERDLNDDLGCVLYPSHPERIFKEQEEVILQVQELLGLLRFHQSLLEEPEEETNEEEVSLLDQELSTSWKDLSSVVEEVLYVIS